ncbi:MULTISPECIES: Ig-like domain-containing protein [Streptacidiphilus]|uniref:Ig-like domain-containing protein n=2 Tax=Streptacidiphilus TaxID=228398 RepID=A0ABV6UM43_9ACTN|nr:Ig-like domain-containing protein [Streptacidiphilus jeojiense]
MDDTTTSGKGKGGPWARRTIVAGLIATPVALVAGCSSSGSSGSSDKSGSGGSSAAPVSKAAITTTPANGAKSAVFTQPVKVAVSNGTLSSVTLTGSDGKQVAGELAADKLSWTSTGRLSSGTGYTLAAVGTDSDQVQATKSVSFRTGAPEKTFIGYFTPDNGTTVGVGMPVSINFNKAVTDKAAVQKAITVTASPAVEIVGHWFSSTRLDFRPETYWAAGTKVTLTLALKDVEGSSGVYGTQAKSISFTVGRSQTSVADLSAKTLTVTRDGKVTQTYPITGGSPEHTTWAGKMVISEKFLQTRMDSTTVGLGGEYDIKDVPHAQRLTTSGTFIHGNYWASTSVFGSENTSHGCVAMHDTKGAGDSSTPAAKFYNSSITGDVVEVVNSGDKTVDPANGLNGWNLDWASWKAGSAV